MKFRNAVILHGKPSEERYHNPDLPKPHQANWLPWAAERLEEEQGITTAIPVIPHPYAPRDSLWQATLDLCRIDKHTLLIGHSAGAGFILKQLCEGREVGAAILVAPWTDPNSKYGDFLDFRIGIQAVGRCATGMEVFYSSADDDQAKSSFLELYAAIPPSTPRVNYSDIPHYGHFMIGNKMSGPEFPELLEAVDRLQA